MLSASSPADWQWQEKDLPFFMIGCTYATVSAIPTPSLLHSAYSTAAWPAQKAGADATFPDIGRANLPELHPWPAQKGLTHSVKLKWQSISPNNLQRHSIPTMDQFINSCLNAVPK